MNLGSPSNCRTPTQVVGIDRFFDGNDDLGSIGCNLDPHPGIARFIDGGTMAMPMIWS